MNHPKRPRSGLAASIAVTLAPTLALAQPCQPVWAPLPAPNMNDISSVQALALFDGDIYAGGIFNGLAGTQRIARYNGSTWSVPGSGIADQVNALATLDGSLFAGGSFAVAGGVSGTSRFARWDGEAWTSAGGGVNATVYAIAAYDDGLDSAIYPAGNFSIAGGTSSPPGISSPHIAKWDGQSWSPLLNGMNNDIRTLAVFNGSLYAGGSFTSAGGLPAFRVARWDGSSWWPLAGGIGGSGPFGGSVWALAAHDDGTGPALFVGGQFTENTSGATNIVKWDGDTWSAVGAGVNGQVRALASFDDGGGPALYVGGSFSTAGGVASPFLARWKDQAWSEVGGGVNAQVLVLAVLDGALYAGGTFTNAGGVQVDRIARWGCPPPPPCYANCDGSTAAPILNVDDFTCFINEFAAGQPLPHAQQIEHYANCDNSTIEPVLNVDDFTCFINAFAQGCP